MTDHRKRFNRWRNLLPEHSAFLVDLVLARIVPEFERHGFVWYGDFAGDDPQQIGATEIPLQRRQGELWPTVQILFDKRRRPSMGLDFAMLPSVCKRAADEGYVDVPRQQALVFEGPEYFSLCQGRKRDYDCNYGYFWFRLRPRRFLEAEVEYLRSLLPELFELFEQGIPTEWTQKKFGQVSKHVFLLGSRRHLFADAQGA